MKRLILPFVLLIVSSFAPVPKPVLLQYTFTVGDQFEWIQTAKQIMTQSVMGMSQEIQSSVNGVTKLKVIELTASGAKLEIEYAKLSVTTKTPMGEMVMDSETPASSNENKAIQSIMGKKFYFFMSRKGDVEKIEGIDNLWSGLSSLGLDASASAMSKQIMERIIGEESLKGSLEAAFIRYSDAKVKAGDTWKYSSTISMGFPVQVENSWTLSELSSTSASLSAQGTIASNDKEKITDLPNNMRAKFDLNGTHSSHAKTLTKNGWASEMTSSSEIKGTMIILAGGQIPSDMEIPMQIKTESTHQFVKK